MKKNILLLSCLLTHAITLPEQKAKPKSYASAIQNGLYKARKGIGNITELCMGAGALGYLLYMLPGKSSISGTENKYGTIYKIMAGDKFWITTYALFTVVCSSLIANGIEGLQQEHDLSSKVHYLWKKMPKLLPKAEKKKVKES